jgi:Uma2 family endonuclease
MSLAREKTSKISEEEYLKGELISDIKHEYVDGEVYAMAGASKKHNLISRNVSFEIEKGLRNANSLCSTFSFDMKVKVTNIINSFFYPDIMVVCENNDDDYYQNSPVIIVEVLSKSTGKYDKSNKRLSYFNIPTLKEYVLIEQDRCEIVIFEKDKGWQSSYYFLGDEITFKSIDVSVSVEDIYYQIESEELDSYFEDKELADKELEDKELKEKDKKGKE